MSIKTPMRELRMSEANSTTPPSASRKSAPRPEAAVGTPLDPRQRAAPPLSPASGGRSGSAMQHPAKKEPTRLSASPPPFIPARLQAQYQYQQQQQQYQQQFSPMAMGHGQPPMPSPFAGHAAGMGAGQGHHTDINECVCPTCQYYRAAMFLHHHPHLQLQLLQAYGVMPPAAPGAANPMTAMLMMQQAMMATMAAAATHTGAGHGASAPSTFAATEFGSAQSQSQSPPLSRPLSMSPGVASASGQSPSPMAQEPRGFGDDSDSAAAAAAAAAATSLFPAHALAPFLAAASASVAGVSPSAHSPSQSQSASIMTASDALNQFRCTVGHIAAAACTSGGRAMLQSALRAQRPDVVATTLAELVADLETVAVDANGCHVLRSLVEVLNEPQADALAAAMSERVVLAAATTSQHTRRTLQTLFERHHAGSANHLQPLVELVAANALYLSQTQQGCIALMRVFERCDDAQKHALAEPLLPKLARLAVDPFGNYVVQCVLVNSNPVTRAQYVMRGLRGAFAELACNKFSSNVLERVVRHATAAVRAAIVDELVMPDAALEAVASDQFGNFVLQTLVETAVAPGEFELVSARVRAVLTKTPYARKLEAKLKHALKIVSGGSGAAAAAPFVMMHAASPSPFRDQ
jgi:hypothetical protein